MLFYYGNSFHDYSYQKMWQNTYYNQGHQGYNQGLTTILFFIILNSQMTISMYFQFMWSCKTSGNVGLLWRFVSILAYAWCVRFFWREAEWRHAPRTVAIPYEGRLVWYYGITHHSSPKYAESYVPKQKEASFWLLKGSSQLWTGRRELYETCIEN